MIAHDSPEAIAPKEVAHGTALPTIIEQVDHYARSFYTRQDGLMNKRQVADYLNVSVRTVDNLVAEGQLFPVRVRSAKRFTRKSVERYVATLEKEAR